MKTTITSTGLLRAALLRAAKRDLEDLAAGHVTGVTARVAVWKIKDAADRLLALEERAGVVATGDDPS